MVVPSSQNSMVQLDASAATNHQLDQQQVVASEDQNDGARRGGGS